MTDLPRRLRRPVRIACLAFAVSAGAHWGCAAASDCVGSISASTVYQVSAKVPISIQVLREGDQAVRAAQRFVDGMRAGGAVVSDDARARMSLAFLFRTAGQQSQQFLTFGEVTTAMGAAGQDQDPSITLTATLTDTSTYAILWVASVDCRITTRDPDALSYDLGRVIGSAIGQSINKSFR